MDELTTGFPHGDCLLGCSVEPCPEGLVCVAFYETKSCLIPCAQTSECPPGRVCATLADGGPLVCQGLCQKDSDCPARGYCNLYLGICESEPTALTAGDTGDPCQTDLECTSEICIPSSAFPDGYCSAFCSLSLQGCPSGSHCAPIWSSVGDMGMCLKDCTTVDDCRPGYSCLNNSAAPGFKGCVKVP